MKVESPNSESTIELSTDNYYNVPDADPTTYIAFDKHAFPVDRINHQTYSCVSQSGCLPIKLKSSAKQRNEIYRPTRIITGDTFLNLLNSKTTKKPSIIWKTVLGCMRSLHTFAELIVYKTVRNISQQNSQNRRFAHMATAVK